MPGKNVTGQLVLVRTVNALAQAQLASGAPACPHLAGPGSDADLVANTPQAAVALGSARHISAGASARIRPAGSGYFRGWKHACPRIWRCRLIRATVLVSWA